MKQMKIYIASPFFNKKEVKIYNYVIRTLRSYGYDLFVPREHEIEGAWDMPNQVWGEAVFGVDYTAIQKCDVVVVLNWGMYSDTGTAWECGCAFALGKKVINVCVNPYSDYSLMMTNGCHYNISLGDLINNPIEGILSGTTELKKFEISVK